MNILFIASCISYGGAEKMQTFVANSLCEKGHQVAIINLNMMSQKVQQQIHPDIRVFQIDGNRKGVQKLRCLGEIIEIAKEMKAQLLIGFTMFPNLYACLAGKWLRIPSIMSERGDPNRTLGTGLTAKLLTGVINRCTGGVFQTEGAKAYYGKRLQKASVVIPNPVFLTGEIPAAAPEREKTVVSVGRLANLQKRYDVMLKAFAIFSRQHPQYRLKLYGDGPDEENIRQWIRELEIQDRVELMGVAKKPMAQIVNSGMFLITSDFEGISNALLEAMAVGLPCVSTDHTPGGARLLITHGENGLLAPMGNPEALAQAMCRFAEDSLLAENCGRQARQVLERFAPEAIAQKWEDYCRKIISL